MSSSDEMNMLGKDISRGTGSPQVMIEIYPSQLSVEQLEVQRVVFEERLVLEDDQGQRLDEVTIAVEADDEDMFLVYQYSKDESRLLRVQSRVHGSLETDTELRRIKGSDHTRTLRITDAEDSCRVFILNVIGKEGWRKKMEYDKHDSDFIILEGSNIILLRKLAINGLFGQFRGQTINHEGELCECVYSVEPGEDDGDIIVRRVVTSTTGQEMMTTLLSRGGFIRSHRWSSSDWRLVGDPLWTWTGSDASSLKTEHQDSPSELSVVEADTEAYFQKKQELIEMMKMYFLENPDVQDMIADFLKNLLFEKPKDVVDFADKFFSEFVGIDWALEASDSSFSSTTVKTESEIESTHTEEFICD